MDQISQVDARGLLCPLPVLKARKALSTLPGGAMLVLLTDDPAAVIDVPHFCTENGHVLVEHLSREGHDAFTLRKAE